MLHDLTVVIALAWVSVARTLTQRPDEPPKLKSFRSQQVVNAFRLIPSSSAIVALPEFMVICLNAVDDLSWHFKIDPR